MYVFEDLKTYNKIVEIGGLIKVAVGDFPRSTGYFSDRFLRLADEMRTCFAQANEVSGEIDPKERLWKVRATIEECFSHVEIAARQGLLSPSLHERFRVELAEISEDVRSQIRHPAPVHSENHAPILQHAPRV